MSVDRGAICLTFDDRNFAGWRKIMPLLQEYEAHATFFISGKIDADALSEINALRSFGHSVGLHGSNHWRSVDKVTELGETAYLEAEILPQLEVFKRENIPLSAFGYPFSQQNETTEQMLKKYFRHLRTGAVDLDALTPLEMEKIFLPWHNVAENILLHGVSLGRYSNNFDPIAKTITYIAAENRLGVFYSHDVTPEQLSPNNITIPQLTTFLECAAKHHVKLIGFNELP